MNYSLSRGFLVVVLPVLMLIACNKENTPKNVASRFLNAFNEKNYEEARKYSTPETIKLIDLMENLSKMSTSTDSVSHDKIIVLEEKIDGETATVIFRDEGSD